MTTVVLSKAAANLPYTYAHTCSKLRDFCQTQADRPDNGGRTSESGQSNGLAECVLEQADAGRNRYRAYQMKRDTSNVASASE